MKEFLDFFLSNHLGLIIFFIICLFFTLQNFAREFLLFFYTNYYWDNKPLVNIFLNLILIHILFLFITIDLHQPNNEDMKLLYFILSLLLCIILPFNMKK